MSENYIGDTDEKTTVNEHRIYQQFTTKQAVGKLNLSHRYRFEQRFVESDFKMRFRYFLSLNYPLKTAPPRVRISPSSASFISIP